VRARKKISPQRARSAQRRNGKREERDNARTENAKQTPVAHSRSI
jgi:hypothetical protein